MAVEKKGVARLAVENIGGLFGRQEYDLRKGLNIVSAPNAGGKSSLVHALQALILDERDLRSRDYFLHMFEQSGRVELALDGAEYVRRLRVGRENILTVAGAPLHEEGHKVDLFCVASEENELIERVKTGKPLRNTLLDFSDYRHYEILAGYFEQRRMRATGALSQYREQVAAVETLKNQLQAKEEELQKLESERKAQQEIPPEKLAKSEQEARKLRQAQQRLQELMHELSRANGDRDRLSSTLEDLINQEARLRKIVEDFEHEHPDIEQELSRKDQEIQQLQNEIADLKSDMEVTQRMLQLADQNWQNYLRYQVNECFACGQPTDAEHLRQHQRSLEKRKGELSNDINERQWRFEQRKKERNQLQEQWTQVRVDLRQRLNSAQRDIELRGREKAKVETQIDELAPQLEQQRVLVQQFEAAFDADTRERWEQQRRLDERIARVDQDIQTLRQRVDAIGDAHKEVIRLQGEVMFYEQASRHMMAKAEEVKQAVKMMFNARIDEVYRLLEFDESFEQIYLDDQFNLKIIRRFHGQRKEASINTLSRGEKETVALVLMLAGREAYLPDFPFFIADETTFYDATRFKRIMSYIGQRVHYVIVTKLAPKEEQANMVVEYAFAA